jgi:hypothetical protein
MFIHWHGAIPELLRFYQVYTNTVIFVLPTEFWYPKICTLFWFRLCILRINRTPTSISWLTLEIIWILYNSMIFLLFLMLDVPSGPGPGRRPDFQITLRHTTLGRTPLEEWSARRRDLCLTTHNTEKRQTSMPPGAFEVAIPASERPQTPTLDSSATGIGTIAWLYNSNTKHTHLPQRVAF